MRVIVVRDSFDFIGFWFKGTLAKWALRKEGKWKRTKKGFDGLIKEGSTTNRKGMLTK